MGRDVIRNAVINGKKIGFYSHIIVFQDSGKDFKFCYVDKWKDINTEILRLLKLNAKIVEIYNYGLNVTNELEDTEKSLSLKALEFATRMHEGQLRKDGKPYIEHPKNVANYVKFYKKGADDLDILMAAAYLHDTLEDTNLSYYDIVEFFGPSVAGIVLELTTDEELKKEVGKTKYLEIKCKNMSSWALVIKLCDRLDNISDLASCDFEFRERYSNETFDIIIYLLNNRVLNKIHLIIIKEILRRLDSLSYLFSEDLKEKNEFVKSLNKVKVAC